jgi:uncharacterized protein YkwD
MASTFSRVRSHRSRLRVEELERRELLSGYQPTAVEQLFLEDLNNARANPAAYGASIGIDLSGVAPAPPLAFNPNLIQAALLHSQDMNARGYFDHNTPEGVDPGTRMQQAGFAWTSWGESIAGGTAYPGPAEALAGLIQDTGVADLGHRRQLLAIDAIYKNQNQLGIGIVQGGTGPLTNYYTIDTAAAVLDNGPFLTGVVYNDLNGNGQYDIGEGLAGVTITLSGGGSTTTFDSGGYTLAVQPGTYTVTASGAGLAAPISETVTVGGSNVRLNFTPGSDTYIRKFYQTILGRPASNAEVALWLPMLQTPGGVGAVASAIEHSGEARTRLVKSWYVTYLGRTANNGEEQGWVNSLLQGATEADVLAGILSSQEFYVRAQTLVSAGSSDESYIRALYSLLLNRAPSNGEVQGWLATLAGSSRAAVTEGFVHSGEYRALMVQSYYSTILHRSSPASAAEVNYWVASGLDLTSIRVGFEESYEYYLDG